MTQQPKNEPKFNSAPVKIVAASAGDRPPPSPPSNTPRHEQVAQTQETRQRLMVAAAGAASPPPPGTSHPEQTPHDPDRKFGFIVTQGPNGESTTQRYSYLSDAERLRKCDFLKKHPEYEFPPGDPLNAPKNATYGWIISQLPGKEATTETYWYTTDEERQMVTRLIREEF